MLHKVEAIDYIQVCANRLAKVEERQCKEKMEPVTQDLFGNKLYTSTVK